MQPPRQLNEYLYVDAVRLESYFLQISEPVKLQKLPSWKVAFGMTGPQVEATQSRIERQFSTHEKIRAVFQYLWDGRMLSRWRPGYSVCRATGHEDALAERKVAFVLETCRARRVVLPAPSDAPSSAPISMWIAVPDSEPRDSAAYAILLEHFRKDDFELGVQSYSSPYSTLGCFLRTLDLQKELLNVATGETAQVLSGFDYNPIGVLHACGAEVGDLREISVLYRIRTINMAKTHFIVNTVGYPIFVGEGALDF
jgi:hypothetical protein